MKKKRALSRTGRGRDQDRAIERLPPSPPAVRDIAGWPARAMKEAEHELRELEEIADLVKTDPRAAKARLLDLEERRLMTVHERLFRAPPTEKMVAEGEPEVTFDARGRPKLAPLGTASWIGEGAGRGDDE